jgi:hypothetical protein
MGVDRHLLVIAAQAYDGAGLRRLLGHQPVDHAAAMRPAIDIVAEKDVARRPRAGIRRARREQAVELVEAAMNVADRKGQRRGGISGHAAASDTGYGRRQSITAMLQPPCAVSKYAATRRARDAARRARRAGS